jgi:hypothetical protein
MDAEIAERTKEITFKIFPSIWIDQTASWLGIPEAS